MGEERCGLEEETGRGLKITFYITWNSHESVIRLSKYIPNKRPKYSTLDWKRIPLEQPGGTRLSARYLYKSELCVRLCLNGVTVVTTARIMLDDASFKSFWVQAVYAEV